MYKIIVADDHPITLMGTEAFLNNLRHKIVGSYHNGISCLNGIVSLVPDIAIIDVSMPGMSGLEILSIVKFKKFPTKIILLTMHKEMSVFWKANESDVDGYVLKDDAVNDLVPCIKAIMAGKKFISPSLDQNLIIDQNSESTNQLNLLTNTEKKVLELVANHKTNKDIGEFLFISEKTVESHKRNIVEKLKLPKGKNILLQWALANVK
jgi:two-component system nitrate/nitrite response regulator NarL